METPPDANLGLVVVIPCHNEPDVLPLLESLARCHAAPCAVEVWWVVNHSRRASEAIQERNRETLQTLRQFMAAAASKDVDLPFRLGVIEAFDLPPKHAGVGLARKLGMDLAAERLRQVGCPEGIIVNLDADCEVSTNYFDALVSHFEAYPQTPGASLFYAHPLWGDLPEPHYVGITYYELFLRYYTHGLRFSGFPFGFQTVGSSMAVRANIYGKVGGMNRRKAGEDFYFLHKVIEQGNFSEINTLTVKPAARVSDRVPFGTGKAMADYFEDPEVLYQQYPLAAFEILRAFVECVPVLYAAEQADACAEVQALDPVLFAFLQAQGLNAKIAEIQQNTTQFESFQKRFFQWFNGFRVMKALHALRDAYGNAPLLEESLRLLNVLYPEVLAAYRKKHDVAAEVDPAQETFTATRLLDIYRQIDRSAGPFLLK